MSNLKNLKLFIKKCINYTFYHTTSLVKKIYYFIFPTRKIRKDLKKQEETLDRLSHNINEIIMGQVYTDAIRGESNWFIEKNLYPGRWAAGYSYLYPLFRVLNEANPKSILELGLGQSSRMILQYVQAHQDVAYYVAENNQEWIDFFSKKNIIPDTMHLTRFDLNATSYKGEEIRTYKHFRETYTGKKFDLISIDGPIGSRKHYSRIDILSILPDCLSNSFVIMMDDCERQGEQGTMEEIDKILNDSHIPFQRGKYEGSQEVILWTSSNQSFFASM